MAQRGQPIRQSELTPNGWRLESPVVLSFIAKLRASGTPLGEYVIGRFYYGIKTGLNEAFVVDRATRDRLIAEHASSAEVLKPYLRGRDIERWEASSQDRWLIFTRRGININAYPAILRHLTPFRVSLTPGEPGGRKPGSYEWYEIQDNIAFWPDLERTKIVYPDIYEHQSFAWDTTNAYLANTCYFIPTDEKWLCALLNSSAVEWFYGMVSNRVRGGYLRAFSPYMTQVPIPAASPADQATLTALVDRILAAKRSGDAAVVERLEAEIDTHVFRLYGLTPEEIALVKGERK